MRIVDARSGKDVAIGGRVDYPGGEWWRLEHVSDRFFSATALVTSSDGARRVPLQVRFTHPAFFLERVAFYPS